MSERCRLAILAAAAFLSVVVFMAWGLRGNLSFVLELRAVRLLALLQVGIAVAVSTVVFQTVTGNRILTPSIMGLDALYLFGQTTLVFLLGGFGYSLLNSKLKFGAEVLLMMGMALCLLLPVLQARLDMGLMLLTGVVLAVLFRSLTSLVARLVDPNEFAVVQVASFASFSGAETGLIAFGLALTAVCVILAWRARHMLDILALGRDTAISLGVEWQRTVVLLLVLVSALVAVSTALVGPVSFLGLLVVALAERFVNARRHAVLLPGAVLTSVTVLVGGQTLLQHAFGGASALGVVIEFIGGLVFLSLLIAASRR